jgi:hypothetical protein
MKLSLLGIVQEILNELDSDAVDSIDDTVESQQVAAIVRSCFNELTSNRNWPHLKKIIQLESSGDLTKPNYLIVPDRIQQLEFFKYDKRKSTQNHSVIQDVLYKDPWDFLTYISGRNSETANTVEVTDFSGTTLLIKNNVAPQFWTSFDDTYLVTDSYDATIDDTLKKSKTQCHAYMTPEWSHLDSSIPNLPADAFALLIEESKSTAFFTLKQMTNQKAEQKAARQNRWLARKDWKAHGGVQYDNYGRSGQRGTRNVQFRKEN